MTEEASKMYEVKIDIKFETKSEGKNCKNKRENLRNSKKTVYLSY